MADIFPGNGFCFAGIKILNPAGDFVVPGGLHGFGIVMGAIQALQQRACQLGAFFHGKGEGALQQFSSVMRHGIVIRPDSAYGTEGSPRTVVCDFIPPMSAPIDRNAVIMKRQSIQ